MGAVRSVHGQPLNIAVTVRAKAQITGINIPLHGAQIGKRVCVRVQLCWNVPGLGVHGRVRPGHGVNGQCRATGKHMGAVGAQLHIPGALAADVHFLQRLAVCKCARIKGSYAVRHHHACQGSTIPKCVGGQRRQSTGQQYRRQGGTVLKHMVTQGGDCIRQFQHFQRSTAGKGAGADLLQAVGQLHILQLLIIGKGFGANGTHALAQRDLL